MKEILITQEQLDKFSEELGFYLHTKRPEVVQRIKEAKSFGDLSENSEYDSAREEQAFIEAKIKDLETLITNAKIIDSNVSNSETVVIGSVVTFEDVETKEKATYKLVGVGSNPMDEVEPSISTSSVIGRSILTLEVDATVDVDVPAGKKTLRILKID